MRKLELTDVYEASYNSDSTEGRGYGVHLGYFTHEKDAKKAVIGMGVMGTPGDVRKITTSFVVYDTFAEYETARAEDARASGLAKLTHAEKKALGIK